MHRSARTRAPHRIHRSQLDSTQKMRNVGTNNAVRRLTILIFCSYSHKSIQINGIIRQRIFTAPSPYTFPWTVWIILRANAHSQFTNQMKYIVWIVGTFSISLSLPLIEDHLLHSNWKGGMSVVWEYGICSGGYVKDLSFVCCFLCGTVHHPANFCLLRILAVSLPSFSLNPSIFRMGPPK